MMPVSEWRQLSHRFHARSEERGLYVNKEHVQPPAGPERSTPIACRPPGTAVKATYIRVSVWVTGRRMAASRRLAASGVMRCRPRSRLLTRPVRAPGVFSYWLIGAAAPSRIIGIYLYEPFRPSAPGSRGWASHQPRRSSATTGQSSFLISMAL